MPEAENRNATISKLSDSINNDQLAIEALSKEATDVSTEYKSSILFLMTDIFTALKTLADSVAGDYDSRTRKDSSTKVTISATLMSNIKDCEAKSFSGSEKVQSDVLKVFDFRADLGSLKKNLQAVRAEVDSDKTGEEQKLNTQNQIVAQADAAKAVAQQSYDKAKDESDRAASDAKWWKDFASNRPWWGVVTDGFQDDAKEENQQKILFALQKQEAAKIDANTLSQRQTLLSEAQTALKEVQVRAAELDLMIAQLTHVEGVADKALQGCENTIALCQNTEVVMLQCKNNTTKIRDKCVWLRELTTGGEYVQTKADYVDVLIDCVQFGIFDKTLAAIGKAIIESLKAGDQTNLLEQKDYAEKVSRTNSVLTGFEHLSPPATF